VRQYLEFTACLLTEGGGVAGPEAAPVWAGMQDASLATRAKVQYLAVSGPQTVDNAVLFASSLAQNRCNLVFAAGDVQTSAVVKVAPRFPGTAFVVVGSGASASNVSRLDGSSATEVRAAVRRTLTTAAGGKR
jgi:basic membrane lipoprotein Med (substrate-binding protein (PBP1-ABC) superfamily)